MHGVHENVSPLHQQPFNVGGNQAWACRYASVDQIRQILTQAFASMTRSDFAAAEINEAELRAEVTWNANGKIFHGDILVNSELKPIGFFLQVHQHYMVFSHEGSHIPVPRFVKTPTD